MFKILSGLILLQAVSVSCSGAGTFWDAQPGARANAMGTAYTSLADDPYVLFYNPAGLAGQEDQAAAFGLGRRFAISGPCGELSAVYLKPVPDLEPGTAGLGYYGFWQNGVGKKDLLTASIASKIYTDRLEYPVYWGAGVKIISVRQPGRSRAGVGADAGVIMEIKSGWRAGAALMDLDTKLDVPMPFFNIGTSYAYKNFLFALDIRTRQGFAQVFPGIEMSLDENNLKLRLGKGLSLDHTNQVAMGVGFNIFPFNVDTTVAFPVEGFHTNSGQYQVTAGYAFGYSSAEKTTGTGFKADARAAALKKEIEYQEKKRAELGKEVREAEEKLYRIESQMKTINAPAEIPESEKEKPVVSTGTALSPDASAWPKKHTVAGGDTLRSIARQYYGDPSLWRIINLANLDKVSKGLPVTGQVLDIPAPPPAKALP